MDNLPCEYIIHGLPVMNSISHALFSRNLLCFPSRVRFVFPFAESNISLLLDNCRMLAIYPFELSFVYPDAWYRLSLFLVSHLLYTSVSLVSFPFEYIIHGLPVMNNMSHALFGRNPLLIFPSRVRFAFLVESNVHPINKSAVLAFFRVMSVLEHKPIHDFGFYPINNLQPGSG